MEVRFTHPRTSDTFVADISPLLTAKQALQALLSQETGPFLPPQQSGEQDSLVLHRTNTVIPPDTQLGDVGVVAQDVLDVMRGGQGAYQALEIHRNNNVQLC